jgi:UDP-glucose 4-epimerase
MLAEINVRGTMRTLEAARRNARGCACVVYSSSFEVYGEVSGSDAITENVRLNPMTDYGATKLSGEDHLLAFAYEEKTRVVALRMPAIYGPGEHTPRALPNFLKQVAAGVRPTIFGDGADLRDQLHVRDAARAIALGISSSAQGIFNVADGEPHSILQLARTALEVAGMSGDPEMRPRQKARVDCHMSIAKARAELGFAPSVTLRDGMAEQLASLR